MDKTPDTWWRFFSSYTINAFYLGTVALSTKIRNDGKIIMGIEWINVVMYIIMK